MINCIRGEKMKKSENKILDIKKEIEENAEILRNNYNFDQLKDLKVLKYGFTLKAKNKRDVLIITNAIALILTVMLSLITFSQTVFKASYEDSDKIIQRIDNYKMEKNKSNIDENASDKMEAANKEIKYILQNEIEATKEKLYYNLNVANMIIDIMIGFIILIIATYIILIKTFSGRAAYYETLVIMIDERINEIKAGSWEKAQKVELKIEDGITIKDNVTIRY